jgi:homoserine O-succinyltransferase/O-acetyltransferase
MNDGVANQGMRCIFDIVSRFENEIEYRVYDVRAKSELPDIADFDIYISSGGPGNPLEGDGKWDQEYYHLIDSIWNWNLTNPNKKHILFICHSFQMACKHFGLAEITKRESTSFGVMTIHKTQEGFHDPLFGGLDNPFFAVDSRDFQVVQPRLKKFKENGATILALEKIRNNVEFERAIMAVRFSNEFVGTQFHPEADPAGFVAHLKKPEIREKIILLKGKTKYRTMLEQLMDEDKIYKTNETLIPNFLRQAIENVSQNLPELAI